MSAKLARICGNCRQCHATECECCIMKCDRTTRPVFYGSTACLAFRVRPPLPRNAVLKRSTP